MQKGLIVTLTGPSLSGKSTLESLLVERGLLTKATSCTTRSPRSGEVHGQHYYFLTPEEFSALESSNKMVESVSFDKNSYGVTKEEIERQFSTGKAVVIVVDPHGAQQIKKHSNEQGWDCLRVFISNPEEVLKARFEERFKHDALASRAVYDQRWISMKTTEQQWREQMKDAELIFNQFDSSNHQQVVSSIESAVHQTQTPILRKKNKI